MPSLNFGGSQPYSFMDSLNLKKNYFDVLGLDNQAAVQRAGIAGEPSEDGMMRFMREQADADRAATIQMNADQIAAADRANIPWERQLQESDKRYGQMTQDARRNAAIAQQYDMEKSREQSMWQSMNNEADRKTDAFNKNNLGIMGMVNNFYAPNNSRWG